MVIRHTCEDEMLSPSQYLFSQSWRGDEGLINGARRRFLRFAELATNAASSIINLDEVLARCFSRVPFSLIKMQALLNQCNPTRVAHLIKFSR